MMSMRICEHPVVFSTSFHPRLKRDRVRLGEMGMLGYLVIMRQGFGGAMHAVHAMVMRSGSAEPTVVFPLGGCETEAQGTIVHETVLLGRCNFSSGGRTFFLMLAFVERWSGGARQALNDIHSFVGVIGQRLRSCHFLVRFLGTYACTRVERLWRGISRIRRASSCCEGMGGFLVIERLMLQVRSGSLSNCNTARPQGNRFVFLHDGAAGKVMFLGPVPASLCNRVWQVNSCWSVLWGSFSMLSVLVFVCVCSCECV